MEQQTTTAGGMPRVWGDLHSLLVGLKTSAAPHGNQCDPATPPLGLWPKDSISYFTDTCSVMFTASLFTIARRYEKDRCEFKANLF